MMKFARTSALMLVLVLSTPFGQGEGVAVEFTDVRAQTVEFMGYYSSITLTPEQENVKREALSTLPAACCSDNSAYSCCCICNLSRTIWGLTAYLITEHGYGPEEIRDTVVEWVRFVNPDGFPGNSCYRGGCMRSFADGGCGGMSPDKTIW